MSVQDSYNRHMIKNNTTSQNGILKWGKKEWLKESAQSSYYDHTYYKVPFQGFADVHKMRTSLSKRFPNTGNYFGGYTTVGDISVLDESHVKVELVYHIGN